MVPERNVILFARASPLMLVLGIFLSVSDCMSNNDFVAYDAKRIGVGGHVGAALVLMAPIVAIIALVLNRMSKLQGQWRMNAGLFLMNCMIAVSGVLYAMVAVSWAIHRP